MNYGALFCLTLGLTALCRPAWAEPQTMDQAMALAYRANPALQAERARVRAVDEKIAEAESGWRPSVDAVGAVGPTYQNPPVVAGGDDKLFTRQTEIQFKQPVFQGFRTESGIRVAEGAARAASAALASAEQKLLMDVGTTYLDVVQAEAVVELNQSNESVLREQLQATQKRLDVGDVTKTDLSQAESRLQRAIAGRVQAEGELASVRATFARLVGDMPGKLQPPALELSDVADVNDVIARAEVKNPDVITAQYEASAAKDNVDVAKGSLLPEVNIVGRAGRGWEQSAMVTGRQDSGSIMAELTIPLYRSGSDYAKTRAARQTATQQRLMMEDVRNRSREAAQASWAAVVAARATLESKKAEVRAAVLALHGVREEAKVGTRTTLDILNAEQECLDAKVMLAKALRDLGVAIMKTRMAMGELTADAMKLPVDAYDPATHRDDTRGRWIGD